MRRILSKIVSTQIGRIIVLLLLAAAFFACSKDIEESKTESVLNRGLGGEPESLNQLLFESNQAATVLNDLGEGLVYFDGKGNLVGGVAESWSIGPSGKIYRFKLRSDAKWSNGDAVESQHFVNAFRAVVATENLSPHSVLVDSIQGAPEIRNGQMTPNELGVTEISATELEIELHTVTPYFLQLLAHPSLFPVYELGSDHSILDSSLITRISNGAYKFSSWNVGSDLAIIRNRSYWNDSETHYDRVMYHLLESEAELLRYRAGELDLTANVPSAEFQLVKNEFGDELKVAPYLGVYFYGFNLKAQKFNSAPQLRKALSLAIDREVLVSKVVGRGEQPAYGWVPNGIYNYESQVFSGADFSQEERNRIARKILEGAGYGPDNPLRFQLRFNTSDVQQRIALAIQSMWHDVLGVEVDLVNEEFRVLLDNIRAGDVTEVFRLSWTGEFNDPYAFLQIFESSHPTNLTRFSNVEYDALIASSKSEADPANRRIQLESAEKILLETHAVIPLYFYVSKHLVDSKIENWHPNILDQHPSQELRQAN